MWTGAVFKIPKDEIHGTVPDADLYPEDEPANIYLPCETCQNSRDHQGRRMPFWMRFEEIPQNATLEIVVPVILPNADAA